jgi:hypothetical protein
LSRYLEIVFRSKLRLLVLVLLLPIAFSALDLYLWRSYDASEVVWVPDPGIFGQGTANSLGFDPYSTASQNFARLFSNLLGSQSFNDAIGDRLQAAGKIQNDHERALLIASLSQLSVAPGRAVASSGGGGGGGGAGGAGLGDHIISVRYTCIKQSLCLSVVSIVVDVFREQFSTLKARSIATVRAIYEANLKAALADVAAATAKEAQYLAGLPKTNSHTTQAQDDPTLAGLKHELEAAQKAVDAANAQLQSIDNLAQVTKGIAADLTVIDGPKMSAGMYGIKGLSNNNIKSDTIAWAACLAIAAAFVILVAFLDRTVRDPVQVKNRLRAPVITIPDYQVRPKRRWLRLRRAT